jgi:hypothetical protein
LRAKPLLRTTARVTLGARQASRQAPRDKPRVGVEVEQIQSFSNATKQGACIPPQFECVCREEKTPRVLVEKVGCL